MSETTDAYAAPKSDQPAAAESTDGPLQYGPATQGQRLANMLLDTFAYYVLSFCCGIVLALTGLADVLRLGGGFVFGFGLLITYYVVCEAFFGRTLGKLVTGTRVVSEDGSPPSFGQVLGRTLARFVPFEVFSFFGSGASGWHDSWTGTRVVRTRA